MAIRLMFTEVVFIKRVVTLNWQCPESGLKTMPSTAKAEVKVKISHKEKT